MRAYLIFLLLIATLVSAGCKHAAATAEKGGTTKPTPKAQRTATAVVPASQIEGNVVLVNARLRYVVVDFYASPMPDLGQQLNVYRQGQKVGEIRISGPTDNKNTVADITEGEAREGDKVRP